MITIRRLHWIAITQFGCDPKVAFRSLRSLPRYVRGFFRLRSRYKGPVELVPCLNDWFEQAGETDSDYFWQDLLVARMVFEANPAKHVDIGSRIDGFVAHVAAFREIEVWDIRPLDVSIPRVSFRRADLTALEPGLEACCDSLSCLHALEHFGLGRYGDEIDPGAFERGFANMAAMLRPGGSFYLSLPIGASRIEFNAHRISDPCGVIDLARQNKLDLSSLTVVRNGKEILHPAAADLAALSRDRYSLGIFVFVKQA